MIPYGGYDLAANAGWVTVGTDHDPAAFAVGAIRRWWDGGGGAACPDSRRLMITLCLCRPVTRLLPAPVTPYRRPCA